MTTGGYTNPDLLWTPEQLHGRLGDPNLAIIDVRAAATYAQGWIPGAVHFDLYGISLNDTSPKPLAAFMWMMQHLFEQRGVNLDKTVVFYEGIAGMRAARGFWLLEYLGHTDAHVLDGGFNAWQAAGYPVTTEAPRVREVQFQPRVRESLHISADDLHGLLGTDMLALLDTRADDEYLAKNVRAARGGTIPGSVHLEWVHNLNADGTFKVRRGAADDVRRGGYSPGPHRSGLLTRRVPLLAHLPGVAPARLSEPAQLHRVVEGVGGSAGFADRGAAESLTFPCDRMAGTEARVLP